LIAKGASPGKHGSDGCCAPRCERCYVIKLVRYPKK
jgi:hypothetical protein